MKKAIFLSNRQVLNDIYRLNLEIYTDIDCEIVSSVEELKKVITSQEDWDLFLSLSNFDEQDVASEFLKIKLELFPNTPFIVIGEKTKCADSPDATSIPANLNVKNLIRTVARLLDITANDMAQLKVGELYPLPFRILSTFKKAPCSLFVKISKEGQDSQFTQILHKGDAILERVASYVNQGPKIVYIPSDMRLEVINTVSTNVLEKLRGEIADEEAHDVLEQGMEVIAQKLSSEKEVTSELLEISKRCADTIREVMGKVHGLRQLLNDMMENKTGHIYMHTILSSFVAEHIINEVSWGAEEHAEKVKYVLFFHDIFLVPLYNKFPDFKFEEDLIFSDLLSEKEKELVLEHAALASENLKNFPRLPLGADSIVAQHHGMVNGIGFAIDFKDDVSPLAKVIIISEEFVNLILKSREESGSYDFDSIVAKLNDKFPRHTYKKIIKCLDGIKL